jgi:hypothetical protein
MVAVEQKKNFGQEWEYVGSFSPTNSIELLLILNN